MRHIFTFAQLELRRRKRSAKPTVIITLLVVLVLFIGSFVLLANVGVRNSHKFYTISASDKISQKYIEDSAFQRSSYSNAILISTQNNSYRLATRGGFVSSALQASLFDLIEKKNEYFLEQRNLSSLIFLELDSIAREEILIASPREITSQQTKPESQPQTSTILPESELSLPNPTEELNTISDPVTPQEIPTTTTKPVLTSQENLITQQEEQGEIITPGQLSTISQIKDLFIVIQLMIICNLFSALFGNAIFEEKLNYKSSLLFVAPVNRWEMILGKSLPYFVAAMVTSIAVLYMQYAQQLTNPQTYVILLTLISLYFAMSFLNGILARSNKEYSFLNVFTTSILSLYLLIPSFLANYSTLGYASLFTPLLLAIQETTPRIELLIFVIATYLAVATSIFAIGSNLWNFERLYRYDSPFQKILFMIKASTKKVWQYVAYGIMVVPFIWIIQLVIIALFLIIPVYAKLPVFLLLAALSEEIFRNLIIKAHNLPTHEQPTHQKNPFKYAAAVGIGFALAEKSILLIAIAPFLDGYKLLVSAGVIVPMILHTCFTYCAMKVLQRYPNTYLITCTILAILHAAFNYTVLMIFKVPLI